jgi:predicted amidohydrolase YtcJ
VNSRALAIAGIGRGTPDPPNGRIERDADGEPSGTLREDAIELVRSKLPRRTAAERVAGLRRALALAARHGLTSLFEANADADELAAYAELERRGELGARVAVSLATDLAAGARQLPRLVELRRRHRGPRLRVLGAKIFVDGVLESRTAALLEPYLDRPGQRGKLAAAPRSLAALVVALDGAGLQVHAHAIGDAAVRATLDALGEARRRNGPRDGRHHIAHVQLVHPDDLRRFGRLGVTATVQPLWAWADEYITKLTLPALGAARARWIYPFASLARAGAELACGSDWDVTSIAPLEAIQVGVTRRAPDAAAGPAWLPAEVLDLRALLRCYTLAGARLAFQERLTGTLEPGKAADLVVLERDLFALAATEIARTRVVLTLLEGRPTWSDGQLLPRAP